MSPMLHPNLHQSAHFSLDSIRLRLEWHRKPRDIPINGVAFPTGRFGVPYKAINRRAARHRILKTLAVLTVE